MDPVRFVIPKGSLEQATFKLLGQAWARVTRKERSYHVYLDDPDIQVKMMRPQEIPTLVADGLYDIGITGIDWVREASVRVAEMADLEYGRIRLVAAFPDSLPHRSLDQMLSQYISQKRIFRVSSEYLTTASSFIKGCPSYADAYGDADPLIVTPWLRRGDNEMVQILLSFGATEAKPPDDVDAIIDVTETGTTLVQNKLQIADTVMTSSARLIANPQSLADDTKSQKMRDIASLLTGAVHARKHLHIYFNVRKENLGDVLEQLSSLKRPTVSPLSDPNWYAINTIIRKEEYHSLVPRLSRMGQGLVVHEPRQILNMGQ
ncbi:MAG: ATP phosphoribosyltransferase [Nitrosopumilaceae archaeon]|nr:ATP phosphoribosyltransferase [Nitrosopumilaceae archaeon]